LYSRDDPVQEPVSIDLPANGIRLRFDGSEQQLRLIEVLDFTKNHITFEGRDLVKPVAQSAASAASVPSGPTFKHIYNKFLGPTYAGEYIAPGDDSGMGVYVLSYPGVFFTFDLPASQYSPDKDVVSQLMASPNLTAMSMAVCDGKSWADARETLWTKVLPSVKNNPAVQKTKDNTPDEISLVKIHGGGKLQLYRKWTSASFWIILGETTPQQLVAEIGPPDAVYRKNDKRMTIHKRRDGRGRSSSGDASRPDELTDTDQSSLMTGSEDNNDDEAVEEQPVDTLSGECFYNYFYLGFDILMSTPVQPSPAPPNDNENEPEKKKLVSVKPNQLVATKLVLHGNVPGSYEFNRHRRCRWEIAYLEDPATDRTAPNSETKFSEIQEQLDEKWQALYPPGEGKQRQRGMVLNRGWGDSPGSSCEFLGGWEDSSAMVAANLPPRVDGSDDSTTTLFGFPGLVFEVLGNGYVNAVSVF
jgi:hypothetical protein